jgi:hypothetical protein
MSRHIALTLYLSLLALLPACATQPAGAPEAQLPIYQSTAGAPPRYQVVKRLWIESARSVFWTPSYASEEDAMADFRRQAANLGGNGVINFGCYRMPGLSGDGRRLSCNGTVVRFI